MFKLFLNISCNIYQVLINEFPGYFLACKQVCWLCSVNHVLVCITVTLHVSQSLCITVTLHISQSLCMYHSHFTCITVTLHVLQTPCMYHSHFVCITVTLHAFGPFSAYQSHFVPQSSCAFLYM